MDDNSNAHLQLDQKQDTAQVTDTSSKPSDNLTPDHPRFKEVYDRMKVAEEKAAQVEDLKAEMATLKQQISQRQENENDDSLTADEEQALHKIEKVLVKRGTFLKREDWETERNAETRAQKISSLSGKYDGNNGLPKFDPEEIVVYAKRNGLGDNLEAAYQLMHHDAIVQVEAKKLSGGISPTESEKPTGGDRNQPGGLTLSREDVSTMSADEYEKRRLQILQAIKPKR